MEQPQIHFLTGRIAEQMLCDVLRSLADRVGFGYTVQVMPISVAALMSAEWIEKHVRVPEGTDRVILPGSCQGDIAALEKKIQTPVELGPKDVRMLPDYFGKESDLPDLSTFDIEIIAEINHVPTISVSDMVEVAQSLANDGADIIDLGCIPGEPCARIGDYVRAAVDVGLRVSIDSMEVSEIAEAVASGAELVLSVNKSNRDAAADWGCEVVVIPDEPTNLDSMYETIDLLSKREVPVRADPILEPIGLGLADSLNRYVRTRNELPDTEIMMGIGNLTELTDVDSAGVNFILLGVCQELGIRSVLTTQVINWARSSVRECDIARKLVAYAHRNRIPPKNLSADLVALRDSKILKYTSDQLKQLAGEIKDHNYRIFSNQGELHLIGSGEHISDTDPFDIFDRLAETNPKNLDPSHAFYLGFELCKAMIANQLGKNYVQDEALDWGHLTVVEKTRHRLTKNRNRRI